MPQLLSSFNFITCFEDLQKNEGEAGRRKLRNYNICLWDGLLQSIIFFFNSSTICNRGISGTTFVLVTSIALVTGSMLVVVHEIITEKGIGQGASLVTFLNIVATLPKALSSTIEKAQIGDRSDVQQLHYLEYFCLRLLG